jgi:hypothetical protein
MSLILSGSDGLSDIDGSASTPAIRGTDANSGVFFGVNTVSISTDGTAAVTVDSGQRTKFPTTIGVGNATPSTSGSGVSFPATQSASTDANTLDDYEEGTWTPTFTANVPGNLNIVYATNGRQGYYTKVGRLVTLHFFISMSTFTHTTASSFIKITGLPFASATNTGMEYSSIAMSEFAGITKANYSSFGWYLSSNSSEAIGNASGSGQVYDFINIGDLPSGSTKLLVATMSYFTAS